MNRMVFLPSRQRTFIFHVGMQLFVFAGCQTADVLSSSVIELPLRPRTGRQGPESTSQTDSDRITDAARLTALLSEASAAAVRDDTGNIILNGFRAGRGQSHVATGVLGDNLSQGHHSLERDGVAHGEPSSIAAGSATHDPQGAFVQPARGQAGPDWMQLHHSAAYAFHLLQCPLDCEADWIGDGWCDTECNLEGCNFDGGDCHGWCGGECRPAWPGDGECDLECYKEECEWDGGDCAEWLEQKLPSLDAFRKYVETYKHFHLTAEPTEEPEEIDRKFVAGLSEAETTDASKPQSEVESSPEGLTSSSGNSAGATPNEVPKEDKEPPQLESRQNADESTSETTAKSRPEGDKEVIPFHQNGTETIQHDVLLRMVRGDACECDVKEGKLGNGVCNPECNTYACHFDGFDCHQMCSIECPHVWLADGKCDQECDIPECFYDKGDCWECAPECRLWMIGNNICDGVCNTADCWFDHGDCNDITKVVALDYSARPYVYQFCAKDFIGDGKCDENCFNEESAWDAGDCASLGITERNATEKHG